MARKRLTTVPSGLTILVIDDQEAMRTALRFLLEHEGHTVLTASGGPTGLTLFQKHCVQLVIVDYRMPEMNGGEFVQALRRLGGCVPVLLQSGDTGEQDAETLVKRLGIQGFHDKGDGPEQLLAWVNALLQLASPRQTTERLQPKRTHILEEYLPAFPLWRLNIGAAA